MKEIEGLGEAITELIKETTRARLRVFKVKEEEEAVTACHFTGARNLRNAWGLWDEESPLYKYFKGIGIAHADDMSSIIFHSLHRVLNGKDIDLTGQVKHYQDFWKKRGYKDGIPS